MTVLYVLISTDPYSGSTKSFMILLKGVLKAGINVIVVSPDNKGIYSILCDMGLKVFIVPSKGNTWTGARTLRHKLLYVPRQLGRLVVNYFAHRKMKEIFKDVTIDIIHSNSTVTDLGRHLATIRHIPHIYHIREYGDKDFGLRYFPSNRSFHRYLNTANVYTVCITKDIQNYHGLHNNPNSKVIYNGIIEDFSEGNLYREGQECFLYAGRIEQTKGLLELVKAYRRYASEISEPLPLIVAGEVFDFKYKQEIDNFIDINNLNKHICFLGKCSDMQTLYRRAKAIVIPSKYEGFGRCMPEAMSNGCIVIGHNTGGTKEQFDNGLSLTGTEIGYRYDNEDQLVNALKIIHNADDSDLYPIRRIAFEVVCKLYSYDEYVNNVLSFYNLIINNKIR